MYASVDVLASAVGSCMSAQATARTLASPLAHMEHLVPARLTCALLARSRPTLRTT